MKITISKILYLFFPALFALASLSSCSSVEEPEVLPEVTPQIVFLFSPGGLGDMSYNDCILGGVQQFKKNNVGVDVFMSSPGSLEEAERIFTDWLKRPGSNIPVLFVLASSDYEYLLDEYLPSYELPDNKRILMFETVKVYPDPKVYTFQVSMYGASYLAGASARSLSDGRGPLVLLGNSADGPIRAARDGFIAGYGRECDVECLADDWTGFVMPTYTYRRMGDWASIYSFIFPVAGGSNAGIYRYSREFADSPYLAGMDIDQSGFSNKITGSVVKRLDVLVEEYLKQWLTTGEMPDPQIYGLDSGYSDWLLSPRYEKMLRALVEEKRQAAIENERRYHER